MRLRSQAYSSLYGYAGTAINPHSHICLYDFTLGQNLSSQHLDKMTEFYESLLAWENELSASLKIVRNQDNSLINLNRVNGVMYLIYHQVRGGYQPQDIALLTLSVDPSCSPTSTCQHVQQLVRIED